MIRNYVGGVLDSRRANYTHPHLCCGEENEVEILEREPMDANYIYAPIVRFVLMRITYTLLYVRFVMAAVVILDTLLSVVVVLCTTED